MPESERRSGRMRKALVGGVVAALALGVAGVAWAAESSSNVDDPGDAGRAFSVEGPFPPFAKAPDGSFAEDLAAELGVSPEEVERALEAVAEKRRDEHQRQMAEMLSEHLNGVSVEAIEAALDVAEEQMHDAIEDGELPQPDLFIETLADELGLSEDQVAEALEAMREEAFDVHRERFESVPPLLERSREHAFPPIGPPPGGPAEFAFPVS
jgi:AraC-like DNA-binding protein